MTWNKTFITVYTAFITLTTALIIFYTTFITLYRTFITLDTTFITLTSLNNLSHNLHNLFIQPVTNEIRWEVKIISFFLWITWVHWSVKTFHFPFYTESSSVISLQVYIYFLIFYKAALFQTERRASRPCPLMSLGLSAGLIFSSALVKVCGRLTQELGFPERLKETVLAWGVQHAVVTKM